MLNEWIILTEPGELRRSDFSLLMNFPRDKEHSQYAAFHELAIFRSGIMTDEVAGSGSLQALLLQAGIWEPKRAREAWDEFCARVDDIEALPEGGYELFPLVAANLTEFAPTLPHRDYLLSVLKHSWARSQSMFASVLPILQAFKSEGIDFLAFKGIALTPLYYKNWGARPGMNLGLLIHPQDVERTFSIMALSACVPLELVRPKKWNDFVRYRFESFWLRPDKVPVQLRWHLVQGYGDEQAEKRLREQAVPCPLPDLQAGTLCATDHFLQTCVDGTGLNRDFSLSWLTDAAMILRSGKINWTELEERAHQSQRIHAVRETLLDLDLLDLGVPKLQLEHWRQIKVSALENLEAGWRTQRRISRVGIKTAAMAYLRLHRDATQAARPQNLWAYLQQLHEMKGILRQIVLVWYVIRWNRFRNTSNA